MPNEMLKVQSTKISDIGNLFTKIQADGQVFYSSAQNLDRFLSTGFFRSVFQTGRLNRIDREDTGPVTGFPAGQDSTLASCPV